MQGCSGRSGLLRVWGLRQRAGAPGLEQEEARAETWEGTRSLGPCHPQTGIYITQHFQPDLIRELPPPPSIKVSINASWN